MAFEEENEIRETKIFPQNMIWHPKMVNLLGMFGVKPFLVHQADRSSSSGNLKYCSLHDISPTGAPSLKKPHRKDFSPHDNMNHDPLQPKCGETPYSNDEKGWQKLGLESKQ